MSSLLGFLGFLVGACLEERDAKDKAGARDLRRARAS
jgi:hypothetical protein